MGRRFALYSSWSPPPAFRSLLVFSTRPFSSVMAEPYLPPLPDRGPEPADNPVAAELAVPPAEAAKPGEENEVIASLIPFVLRPVFRVPCRRSRPLGCVVLICLVGLVPGRFIARFWLVCQDGVRLVVRPPAWTLPSLLFPLLEVFLPRYRCASSRLFFSLCLYCFCLVSFPSAVSRTSCWACVCSWRFFAASAHFISALP